MLTTTLTPPPHTPRYVPPAAEPGPLGADIPEHCSGSRISSIQVRPEDIPAVESLYATSIKAVYQQAPGFQSAYLLLDRNSGAAQSVTVWDSQRDVQAIAETAGYREAMAGLARFVVGAPKVASLECAVAIAAPGARG